MGFLALSLFALAPVGDAPAIVDVQDEVEKRSVLVLRLKTGDPALTGQAELLSDVVAARLGGLEAAKVMTESDLEQLIELEVQKQASGCDQASCLSELAGAIGAELVLYGRLEPLGTQQALSLSVFSQKEAASVGRATTEGPAEEMPDRTRALVEELFPELDVAAESPAAAAPSRASLWFTLGSAGVAAAGGLVALAGLVPLRTPDVPGDQKAVALVAGQVGLAAAGIGLTTAAAGGVWMALE